MAKWKKGTEAAVRATLKTAKTRTGRVKVGLDVQVVLAKTDLEKRLKI